MFKHIDALVYTGANQLQYRPHPQEPLQADEVRVRVEAAGICGSDMHAYHGHDARRVPPMVLGHEAAGVIIDGPNKGQQVALNPLIVCGTCRLCRQGRSNVCPNRTMLGMSRPGAMAAEVAIPAPFAVPLPAGMHPHHAALTEPTACVVHAIKLIERTTFVPLNESRILVIGAGAIGLLAALLLQRRGCQDIVMSEANPLRRATAANCNVGQLVEPSGLDGIEPFDIVFDAVGSTKTRQSALQLVRTGGIVMHIGLQEPAGGLDVRKITLDEIIFLGTYAYTMEEFRDALAAIHAGALGNLSWIETRPLEAGRQAFADLDTGNVSAAKILLTP